MQADSLLRIHLHTHNIYLYVDADINDIFKGFSGDYDNAKITGILIDDQTPIRISITRYNENKKYGFIIDGQKSHTSTEYHLLITDYFTPNAKEKDLFDAFFTSTPLPILQQHLTTILAQRTNNHDTFIEHISIVTRLIQRIPRNALEYFNEENTLCYQDTQHKNNTMRTYWDSLDNIHAWCYPPIFYYSPRYEMWMQKDHDDIISHIMSQYPWDEHHPLSMHETIKLIRQARALGIPSLPKDLSQTLK